MKKSILIILLGTFGTTAFCQAIILKSGTEARYQLSEGTDKKYTLTLIDTKAISASADVENDIRNEKLDSSQVTMVLYNSRSDGKTRSSFLIRSGSSGVIKYSAGIKPAGRRKFFPTDVEPVRGKISSNELWPYEITEIMLSDFEDVSF